MKFEHTPFNWRPKCGDIFKPVIEPCEACKVKQLPRHKGIPKKKKTKKQKSAEYLYKGLKP